MTVGLPAFRMPLVERALDESQFATIGHGILKPKNGMCGADPCAPKTEKQWRDNMRVEFRIIQVEAEADVFQPL